MKYIDADQLKAEIERLYKHYIVCEEYDCGWNNALNAISKFLDTLPEQPVEDLNELIRKWDRVNINTIQKLKVKATGEIIDGFYDGRGHFDHFVDHDIFDRYSIEDVEPIIDERPVEGLEEEMGQWRHTHFKGKRDGDYCGEYLKRESQLDIARHFYILGLNARKED